MVSSSVSSPVLRLVVCGHVLRFVRWLRLGARGRGFYTLQRPDTSPRQSSQSRRSSGSHLMHGVLVHTSLRAHRHLDRFRRFCTVAQLRSCPTQTDRQTYIQITRRATSLEYSPHLCTACGRCRLMTRRLMYFIFAIDLCTIFVDNWALYRVSCSLYQMPKVHHSECTHRDIGLWRGETTMWKLTSAAMRYKTAYRPTDWEVCDHGDSETKARRWVGGAICCDVIKVGGHVTRQVPGHWQEIEIPAAAAAAAATTVNVTTCCSLRQTRRQHQQQQQQQLSIFIFHPSSPLAYLLSIRAVPVRLEHFFPVRYSSK